MKGNRKIISEEEALEIKSIFDKCLTAYENKGEEVSDREWLTQLFLAETSRNSENAVNDAVEIVDSIKSFEENLVDVDDAEANGQSKESWLAKRIKEKLKSLSIIDQRKVLSVTQDTLFETNIHVSEELSQSQDGDYNNIIDITPVDEELYDVEEEPSQVQIDNLARNIGKNVSALAIQNATIVTGAKIVNDILSGENSEPRKLVLDAFQTGVDQSLKIVAAGALQVATDNDVIKSLPENTVPSVVAGIAGMGIENAKVLYMVSSGKITITEGLNKMGKVAIAVFANLWNNVKDTSITRYLTTFIPVLSPVGAVIADVVGTVISLSGGKNIRELIYNTKIKVAKIAKTVAKTAVEGIKKVGSYVKTKITNAVKRVREIFS